MELRRFFLYGARPYRSRAHMKIFQQITPELFSEFLTAKNTKQFCLSCGRLQLFVPHTTIHKVDPDSPEHTDADDWSYVTPNTRIMRQLVFMMRAMK
jgi:hypothetical protein